MRTWVRVLAVFGLLVGLVATAAPVGAGPTVYYDTHAQYAYPRQYTDEIIWVGLYYDEAHTDPIPNITVRTVWNYRTTTAYLDWHTGQDGRAAMIRNISDASCGYTVRVDVYVGGGSQQIDSAYFTPCSDSGYSGSVEVPQPSSPPASSPPAQQSYSGPVSGSYGTCPAGYPIKANDNSGIYHVPGGQFYDATNARNCFATEGAAQAAGYRASYR